MKHFHEKNHFSNVLQSLEEILFIWCLRDFRKKRILFKSKINFQTVKQTFKKAEGIINRIFIFFLLFFREIVSYQSKEFQISCSCVVWIGILFIIQKKSPVNSTTSGHANFTLTVHIQIHSGNYAKP